MEEVAKRLPQLSQRTDLQPAFAECRINSLLLANTYNIEASLSDTILFQKGTIKLL